MSVIPSIIRFRGHEKFEVDLKSEVPTFNQNEGSNHLNETNTYLHTKWYHWNTHFAILTVCGRDQRKILDYQN
jgi:hypothetical protein